MEKDTKPATETNEAVASGYIPGNKPSDKITVASGYIQIITVTDSQSENIKTDTKENEKSK